MSSCVSPVVNKAAIRGDMMALNQEDEAYLEAEEIAKEALLDAELAVGLATACRDVELIRRAKIASDNAYATLAYCRDLRALHLAEHKPKSVIK